MVYLIAGASHTGKTNLAQKMMLKYGYPYISMDHIKMGLVRTGMVPDCHLDDDDAMTEILWPVIREMIKTIVENEQNVIIEGCYLPYNWKESFDTEYLEDIKGIFLVMSPEYIETRFDDVKKYACVIEDRLDDSGCTKEWILQMNRECYAGCVEHGCEYKLIQDVYDVDERIFDGKESNDMQNTVNRIKKMEQYLDDIIEARKQCDASILENPVLYEKIQTLIRYYEGGQWLKDYECDERGEFPEDLKRGVLAEDTLWNLLQEVEEVCGEDICNVGSQMEEFTMRQMQEMQRKLQDKYKHKWEPIIPDNGKNKMLWMIGEIGEVIDIIKKNGAEKVMEDMDIRGHLVEEMADVLMYYNDVMMCYGITPEELKKVYVDKFEKNMKRW